MASNYTIKFKIQYHDDDDYKPVTINTDMSLSKIWDKVKEAFEVDTIKEPDQFYCKLDEDNDADVHTFKDYSDKGILDIPEFANAEGDDINGSYITFCENQEAG